MSLIDLIIFLSSILQKVKHSKLAEDIERLVNDDKQMLPADVDGDNVSGL